MSEPIVRGEGHAPGQGAGEPMPSVPADVQPGSLSSMKEHFARKNAEAQAKAQGRPAPHQRPQATTTSGRIGEFSKQLEAQQQSVQNGEQQPTATGSDPNNPEAQEATEEAQPEQASTPETQQAPGEIDDATALALFREWQQGDIFPDQLLDKVHELTINGRRVYVDGRELRQGYVRGGDYRRQFAQIQQREQQIAQQQQSWQQHWEAIKNPEHMLEIYERNGYGEQLEQVARAIGRRMRQERLQTQAAGYAVMAELGIQDPNDHRVKTAVDEMKQRLQAHRRVEVEQRRLKFERDQWQAQQQQQQREQETSQHQQQFERALSQLRPLSFKVHGLPDTAGNRAKFNRHMGNVIQTLISNRSWDGQITRDICMAAASDMKEEEDNRSAYEQGLDQQPPRGMTPQQWAAQRARQGSGRALPPGRQGSGGGKPLGKSPNGQQRGSLADLERMVRDGRNGRS